MPSVSVVIPTYNRAAMLRQAVYSVLGQTFTDIEVVIVDDASIDMTGMVLQELAEMDERVRFLRHDRNRGAAAARNTGIIAATGDYIALLDSDDLWLAEKLTRQLEYILHREIDVCLCNAFFRKPQGGQLAVRDLPKVPDWDRLILENKGFNAGSTLLAARHLFAPQSVGLFDETLPRLEDWDWFIRHRLAGGSIDNCPYAGAIIRVGDAPSLAAVEASAAILKDKHTAALAAHAPKDAGLFPAALSLERAAAHLWQKQFGRFVSLWLEAFFKSPWLALKFILTRVGRVFAGDAPRLFALFKK